MDKELHVSIMRRFEGYQNVAGIILRTRGEVWAVRIREFRYENSQRRSHRNDQQGQGNQTSMFDVLADFRTPLASFEKVVMPENCQAAATDLQDFPSVSVVMSPNTFSNACGGVKDLSRRLSSWS